MADKFPTKQDIEEAKALGWREVEFVDADSGDDCSNLHTPGGDSIGDINNWWKWSYDWDDLPVNFRDEKYTRELPDDFELP